MPKAEIALTTFRRDALRLAIAGAIGVTVARPVSQHTTDVELIALCRTWILTNQRLEGANDAREAAMESGDFTVPRTELDRLLERMEDLQQTIKAIPAATPEGLKAKALAVQAYWGDYPPSEGDVAASLVRDVVAYFG